MHIALLHARLRVEEHLLLDAFAERGVQLDNVDLRDAVFDTRAPEVWQRYDLAIDRSLSLNASLTATRSLEAFGIRCINPSAGTEVCSDKLRTTLALERANLPTPRTAVATSPDAALAAIERLGYPVVLKPTVGSWGRLIARINDRDAAEAIVEHRATLGSAAQQVYYVQEHIDKPQRDLRVFIVGGEAIAAIRRNSHHWITNTSRGATTEGLTVTDELADLSVRAAAAVNAEIAAIDLLECPERGLLVNEVNHSMEYRNSISVTGVDIPGRIAEYAISVARSGTRSTTETTGASQ